MKIFLFIISIVYSASQLTFQDVNYIRSTINKLMDEKTGMFSQNDHTNLLAVESLIILNENINKKPFCKDLDFSKEEPTYERVVMNEKLNCGVNFKIPENFDVLGYNSIVDLYYSVETAKKVGHTLDWSSIYSKAKLFYTKQALFSLYLESQVASIKASTYGLRLLSLIHENSKNDIKEEISSYIFLLISESQNFIQYLGNDMAVFTENETDTFQLNYLVLEAFESIKNIYDEEKLNKLSGSILNYYLKFKYNMTDLRRINNILKVFSLMKDFPVLKFMKNTIFLDEDKEIPVKIFDLFGREDNTYSVDIVYKKIVEKEGPFLNSPDDLPDENDEQEEKEHKVSFKNGSGKINLDINSPGKYAYKIEATCLKNTSKGTIRVVNTTYNVRAVSKIKISYLKINVSENGEALDEKKETKVEFPKRSFKNIKVTQNFVITVKVKVNF